ncbi:serine protease [Chryseobacterium sp. SIMBA_028]|uniref:S1 family peptidase n=1 Tax=Chryseobacterium sp. SIMBA_028 TaxID=3085771 RepID=UPI003978B2A9
MIEFDQYPYKYENLLIEILEYFSAHHDLGRTVGNNERRTIVKFCQYYHSKYNTVEMPPISSIAAICEILVKNKYLSVVVKDTAHNFDDTYIYLPADGKGKLFRNETLKNIVNERLNCLVFGFKYINQSYKNIVLPICHYLDEDPGIGTCFLFHDGIATAKHCVEHAKKLSIKGIPKDVLETSEFLVHENEKIDLMFIKFPQGHAQGFNFIETEEGQVLDEVLALGFPKVIGFHTFMTAEKATISSRFTPSVGSIASLSEDLWIRQNLMLITAKIKGGNSGGPIINNKGNVVGIATNLPGLKDDYDDLGYGIAIPIKHLHEIIEGKSEVFNTRGIEFIDFIE